MSLVYEIDRHITYYTKSLHEDVENYFRFKGVSGLKMRPLYKTPLHYNQASEIYTLMYTYPGLNTDYAHAEKCVGLTKLVRSAFSSVKDICEKDQTIAWNALYFNIERDERDIEFVASLCLYRQTTDDLVDETMDGLAALKGVQPRVVQDYLYRATQLFL